MATNVSEFVIKVEDRPGSLALLTEVIGKAGVNINAIAGLKSEGKGIIQLTVDRNKETVQALQSANFKYETRELFEVKLQDKPGQLAKLTRSLADAGINVTCLYITIKQTIVFGVDNNAQAAKILQKLGL